MLQTVLAWIQRYERQLGAVVFIFGFITDLLTFTLLDVSVVNVLFAGYLLLAGGCVWGTHILSGDVTDTSPLWRRVLLTILPLGAQYAIGSLLSGFLIFYTKSSVLAVSWPFLVLLLVVFIGNEWFRKYRDRIAFLAVLFFFTLYAYTLFALPLLVHQIGGVVFLASTLLTLGVFGLFLYALYHTGKKRLRPSLKTIVGSSLGISIVIILSYFTGLIPPIPLALKEGGIYHDLRRGEGQYVVQAEEVKFWFDPRPTVVHVAPGETLYAFSSIFAPIEFSASVVHHWERYDERLKHWVAESWIAFPIAGGRASGYRGYSEKHDPLPGAWRVRIETPDGQVIGQLRFTVIHTETPPALHEETH